MDAGKFSVYTVDLTSAETFAAAVRSTSRTSAARPARAEGSIRFSYTQAELLKGGYGRVRAGSQK